MKQTQCKGCWYWKPLDSAYANGMKVCLFCYYNGTRKKVVDGICQSRAEDIHKDLKEWFLFNRNPWNGGAN